MCFVVTYDDNSIKAFGKNLENAITKTWKTSILLFKRKNKMKQDVIPFQGFGEFLLYQDIDESKRIIKRNGWNYSIEVWDNKECTNPVPWTIIRINNTVNLFFANNKLFKIYLCNKCEAALPNGISLGMKLDVALKIDPDLKYDDWEEDYQSPKGYWLEDDLDTGTVMSISIFIKEALDEEQFDTYNW